jgi:hypothetical protein
MNTGMHDAQLPEAGPGLARSDRGEPLDGYSPERSAIGGELLRKQMTASR